jgi:LPXTG-motif cell wall-anchored protein
MRITLIRTALSLGLFAVFLLPGPALAIAAEPAPDTPALQAAATQTQQPTATRQPTPTEAPTGVTPAPTGQATAPETSPPVPGEDDTETTQSGNDMTPLVMAALLLLIVGSALFYLWKRRNSGQDL